MPPTSAWLLLSWESERRGGWDPRHLSQALAFHSLPLPGCPISSILPPPAPSLLPHPGLGSFRDRTNGTLAVAFQDSRAEEGVGDKARLAGSSLIRAGVMVSVLVLRPREVSHLAQSHTARRGNAWPGAHGCTLISDFIGSSKWWPPRGLHSLTGCPRLLFLQLGERAWWGWGWGELVQRRKQKVPADSYF